MMHVHQSYVAGVYVERKECSTKLTSFLATHGAVIEWFLKYYISPFQMNFNLFVILNVLLLYIVFNMQTNKVVDRLLKITDYRMMI